MTVRIQYSQSEFSTLIKFKTSIHSHLLFFGLVVINVLKTFQYGKFDSIIYSSENMLLLVEACTVTCLGLGGEMGMDVDLTCTG